ncbi:MAG: DUF6265 family protein [Bacteroidia bacterium]|jgi:hypothetical protein|nr:DUF6265 family protein [Bacteroidia bacterium]
MKKLAVLLLTGFMLTGCNSHSTLDDFSWMLGSWSSVDQNEIEFIEHWSKSSSSTFTGTGVAIDVTGDTLFKETLKLELIDGVPYYVATVPKNPGPVLFRLAEKEARTAVFENREHDFPQRIRYELDAGNALQIRLDGVEAGKPKVEKLTLKRISESAPKVR